jgi:hypothetical protein
VQVVSRRIGFVAMRSDEPVSMLWIGSFFTLSCRFSVGAIPSESSFLSVVSSSELLRFKYRSSSFDVS